MKETEKSELLYKVNSAVLNVQELLLVEARKLDLLTDYDIKVIWDMLYALEHTTRPV